MVELRHPESKSQGGCLHVEMPDYEIRRRAMGGFEDSGGKGPFSTLEHSGAKMFFQELEDALPTRASLVVNRSD